MLPCWVVEHEHEHEHEKENGNLESRGGAIRLIAAGEKAAPGAIESRDRGHCRRFGLTRSRAGKARVEVTGVICPVWLSFALSSPVGARGDTMNTEWYGY